MIPGMLVNIRMDTPEAIQKCREWLDSDDCSLGVIHSWQASWGDKPLKFEICDGVDGRPDLRAKGAKFDYIIKVRR